MNAGRRTVVARNPLEHLGFVLWQVQHRLQVDMEARLAELRLSLPQFGALSFLALKPNQTSADLAKQLLLSPQATHTLVGRLEAAGYVERATHSAAVGRALPLRVTTAGTAAVRRAAAVVDAVQDEFFVDLTVGQRTTLFDILRDLPPG